MTLASAILVLTVIPYVQSAASAALCLYIAWRGMRTRNLYVTIGTLAAYHLLYPAALTLLQWQVWTQDPLTRILLTLPLDSSVPVPFSLSVLFAGPGGYFIFYALRFWGTHLLTLLIAGILMLLIQYVARAQSVALLLIIAVLTVGWPQLALFFPLLAVVALLVVVVKPKEGMRDVALPIALATIATLIVAHVPIIAHYLKLLTP